MEPSKESRSRKAAALQLTETIAAHYFCMRDVFLLALQTTLQFSYKRWAQFKPSIRVAQELEQFAFHNILYLLLALCGGHAGSITYSSSGKRFAGAGLFGFGTGAFQFINLVADESGGLEVELLHRFGHFFPLSFNKVLRVVLVGECVENEKIVNGPLGP